MLCVFYYESIEIIMFIIFVDKFLLWFEIVYVSYIFNDVIGCVGWGVYGYCVWWCFCLDGCFVIWNYFCVGGRRCFFRVVVDSDYIVL